MDARLCALVRTKKPGASISKIFRQPGCLMEILGFSAPSSRMVEYYRLSIVACLIARAVPIPARQALSVVYEDIRGVTKESQKSFPRRAVGFFLRSK
jgi:hypothetical protein